LPNLDWKAIEEEYRAGVLTNVQIAKNYGCSEAAIRKHAKTRGLKRDLSQQVRQATNDGLVRSLVRGEEGDRTDRTDREIVQAAAARGVEVVRQHRIHLEGLQRISSTLARDIERHVLGEIEAPHWLGAKESVSEAFFRVASASAKWIPLERKAFNLDEPTEKDINKLSNEQLESRIAELLRRRGATRTARGAESAMGAGAATS
jgi:hypothetical protein